MNLSKTVYVAASKIEAEAWINSIGKSKYKGFKLEIERSRDKFLVRKKT